MINITQFHVDKAQQMQVCIDVITEHRHKSIHPNQVYREILLRLKGRASPQFVSDALRLILGL